MLLHLSKSAFSLRTYLSQDGFISHPRPTNSYAFRVLAGLRIYSPDTDLLDNRLLQLTECLSLIRLKVIIQWLKVLLDKDFMSILCSLTALLSGGAVFCGGSPSRLALEWVFPRHGNVHRWGFPRSLYGPVRVEISPTAKSALASFLPYLL